MLSAGLGVLNITAGPVLGAFLLGVLTTSIGPRDMIAGMAAGLLLLFFVWQGGVVAWTWYSLIGASTTALVAGAAAAARRLTFRAA
jgi:hypothetical protein